MNELGGELNVWREHLKLRAKWLVRIGRFRPEARRALRAVRCPKSGRWNHNATANTSATNASVRGRSTIAATRHMGDE